MTRKTSELLEAALRLPTQERAQLAAELLASIDGANDQDAEVAWAVELEERARRAQTGESTADDWEMVRGRIERSLLRR